MRIVITSVLLVAFLGAARADSTTFNSVPANITDAPVANDFLHAERRDKAHVFQWVARFPNGYVWITALHSGRYWPEANYSSESRVLKQFKKNGFSNFSRVESTAYAGSQWGYMTVADSGSRECVVGIVLDNDNHTHDGDQGGTLHGYVVDCGSGAAGRFNEWRTWFRSFKRVPLGYNALLDR